MKITVNAHQLQVAIMEANRYMGLNKKHSILEYVHMTTQANAVTLHTTTQQHGCIYTLSAEVDTSGDTLIHMPSIVKLLKTMNKDKHATITITADVESVHVIGNGVDASLTAYDGSNANDYPAPPSVEWEHIIKVEAKHLWTALHKTKDHISTDFVRIEYGGLHATLVGNTLHMTSADYMTVATHSMSAEVVSESVEPMPTVSIPRINVQALHGTLKGREGDAYIYTDGAWIMVQVDGVEVYTRLIDRYIKTIRSLFEKQFTTRITVNRLQCIKAFEQAQVLIRDPNNTVYMVRGDGKLTITSLKSSAGVSRGHVDVVDYTGETIDVHLNAVYVVKQLKQLESTEVTIDIVSVHYPIVIQPTDGSPTKYIAVPLNVTRG